MKVLTPEEVIKKFGLLFPERFLVMVDEENNLAEIIDKCKFQGPIEWDIMNRTRAGGAIINAIMEGTSLTMIANLGEYTAKFGPAEHEIGGQALESVIVTGDEVITGWAGIAGAGVGIAACLPQAPGVIKTEYPEEKDLNPGGAHICRTRIFSPKYEKITIGIDDTNTTKEEGAFIPALKCAEQCRIDGVKFVRMRIVQLNPSVTDTTNSTGTALVFAVKPDSFPLLKKYIIDFFKENVDSRQYGIAIRKGIFFNKKEELNEENYLKRVKTEIVTLSEAENEAKLQGIKFIDSTGGIGRIGALGALLWEPYGVVAAGLYGEKL